MEEKISKVAIVRCQSYEPQEVYMALKRGLDFFGGIGEFVKPTEKILLKPNMLRSKKKDSGCTTHPEVFNAIIRLLKEAKCDKLTYGDSPGIGTPQGVADDIGLGAVAKLHGIPLGEFSQGDSVSYPEGRVTKRFDLAQAVIESDALISLAKMKTHKLTRITGAIKNQYGCVYGLNKSGGHARFPNSLQFSEMLIDLNLKLKPRLFIMDGIIAMEGNGPASGTPIPMNCMIISDDPVAVDATFARMVDLDPRFVPPITAGKRMGLGEFETNLIQWVGDDLQTFINPNFSVERFPVKDEATITLSKLQYFKNLLIRKPIILTNRCIKCGICLETCPLEEKALSWKNNSKQNYPQYDYKKCIRCYCCQEMCPQKAIIVKTPWLGRILIYN